MSVHSLLSTLASCPRDVLNYELKHVRGLMPLFPKQGFGRVLRTSLSLF